ncbi:MAG: 3D domain-containing protein [Vicinamibacterales bacterium]
MSHCFRFAVFAVIAVAITPAAVNAQTPQRGKAAVLKVSVTAYCVEGKTDGSTNTRRGIVAADPSVLPLGSIVQLEGLTGGHDGTYTVEDTGRTVKGQEIDIFIPDCDSAKQFGRQHARARVVRRGAASKGSAR